MSYYLDTNQMLLPTDAMAEVRTAVLAMTVQFGIRAVRTSGTRLPRAVNDKSYHRFGMALDYAFLSKDGTQRIPVEMRPAIVKDLVERLPPKWFDIVDEKSHIHIEFDPKS